MILTGYILCLIGLFIGCVMVQGFYTTAIVYGTIHLGCALILLFLCYRATAKKRRPQSVYTYPIGQQGISTTEPENQWVITVNLN
jgi:uncharacterized membrane protein YccC